MKYRSPVSCLIALLSLAAPPALAVEPLDTFSVRVGGYVQTFDTEIRADGETQSGTRIDLRRDLGLDDSNAIGYVAFSWRPWEHHDFGLAYYQDDADATRVLQRDIVFEDTTYQASGRVRTEISTDAYEAYYIWWAASHETWALGPRLGLIWYSLDLSLTLEADGAGSPVGGTVSDSVDADLPAPTIGGSWRWTPAEDWRVSAEAGYFSVDVSDIDADVTFGRVGVEWFPWERVGFSLDYTMSRIEADSEKSSFTGNLEFNDSGLRLGAVYRF